MGRIEHIRKMRHSATNLCLIDRNSKKIITFLF